ncbi:MAG: type I methionyl aminopeptidase [Elusimicrobia bacterium CG11_big_fil_rev_8_21_14_0_20_64_6]|nr:MAG: type I methionyl aminopeptidase [Elusimicrobia bacterium CG11_big_fil_rev_8_21_14_0_20_64_6]
MSKAVEVKSREELALMRRAGGVVADILVLLKGMVKPGMTTGDIDRIAREELKKRGAKPAFLNYHGFPGVICVSINSEIVHGIPSDKRVLKESDIVGLDFGAIIEGWYGDSAITIPVGTISSEAQRLIDVTRECLEKGMAAVKAGNRIGDIGSAVQSHAEAAGYTLVREFVGHGIGRALHEEPPIPNIGKAGTGARLKSGMTIAIEPMVNIGGPEVATLGDGWTAVTKDGKLSAHFEHTVAVTDEGFEIMTLPTI